MATFLEGFSVTSHEERVAGAPFKGIRRARGARPGAKNQGGHVKSGLYWPPEHLETSGKSPETSENIRQAPTPTSGGREWGVGSVVVGSAFGAPQVLAPNRRELKIGAPQKRRSNDHGSNAPFSAL